METPEPKDTTGLLTPPKESPRRTIEQSSWLNDRFPAILVWCLPDLRNAFQSDQVKLTFLKGTQMTLETFLTGF